MRILLLIILASCFSAAYCQLSVHTQNVSCYGNCNGAGSVIPPGNYRYVWSSGDTTQTAGNLCAGTYAVTVFNNSLLPLDTFNVIITQPAPLATGNTVSVRPLCYGGTDGRSTVFPTGGTAPYTFIWSNGANAATIDNITAGIYTVTVTDLNNCSATAISQVSQPDSIHLSVTITNPSACGVCDARLALLATGGTPPYTYTWSDVFSNSPTRDSVCAYYYVAGGVYDTNFCGAGTNGILFDIQGNLTASVSHSNNINCANPISTETVNISGGSGSYEVNWPDGISTGFGTNTITHDLTTGGNLSLYYFDQATQCGGILFDTILNLGLHVDSIFYHSPNYCLAGDTMCKIRVAASNGTPPYTYLWSDSAATVGDSLIGKPGYYYTVTATDNGGCSYAEKFLFGSNGASMFGYGMMQSPASCTSQSQGIAVINIIYADYPVHYLWSTSPGDTTSVLSGVGQGTYAYTITDNKGCIQSDSVHIDYTNIGYSVYVGNAVRPNCGISNGTLTAFGNSGVPPYTYLWSNGQTTQTATGLAEGTYSVWLTDSYGCSATATYDLPTGCYNTVNGYVFNDLNGNCTADSGEVPVSNLFVIADNGSMEFYTNPDSTGYYSLYVEDTGTFSISAPGGYWGPTCANITACGNSSQPVSFNGFNNVVNNYNFGYTSTGGFDLALHPGWSSAAPGFIKDYWVFYYNQALQLYTGPATIVFMFDTNLVYLSCDGPAPLYDPVLHSLTWNVYVNSVNQWNLLGACHFQVPATLSSGDLLQSDFAITPTSGDCDSSSNHIHYSETVAGSHDPNEKQVSPAGHITESDSVLTYTIHFQNTGTASTSFVIVTDTLPSNLDPLTVRNIASSHTYSQFYISGTGVLTWVFNPISLASRDANEPASKGFVAFTVKKKTNLPTGFTISNQASIVFDYNEPIYTNLVSDTFGTITYVYNIAPESDITVKAYPNPFTTATTIAISGVTDKFDFKLFDITGRNIKSLIDIKDYQFDLQRGTLPSGVYFYQIISLGKKLANGKLVVE